MHVMFVFGLKFFVLPLLLLSCYVVIYLFVFDALADVDKYQNINILKNGKICEEVTYIYSGLITVLWNGHNICK